jgi:trimeric autotransporter adhesin
MGELTMLRRNFALVAIIVATSWAACGAKAELIGYWSLDGNTNDASSYANNGTGSNVTYTSDVPTAIAGHVSSSAYFNGTSSKVAVGYTSSLYVNSAVTIAFWVKAKSTDQTVTYGRAFSNNSSKGFEFQENNAATDIQLRIDTATSGTGFNQGFSIGNAFDGSWHFVAITADSTGVLTTYFDGVATTHTFIYNSGFGSTSSLFFGSSTASNRWIKGSISDMAMWNTVLTSDQLTSLYNGTATPLTAAVPEPATTVMALTGIAGLLAFAWRKRKNKK